MRRIVPVILAGGAGSRLWPLSTERRPKPFHRLGGGHSLIQDTIRRLDGASLGGPVAPVVICRREHERLLRAQLAEIQAAPAAIVLEPVQRNTAAAAVVAARCVAAIDASALVLLLPTDHAIADPSAFHRLLPAASHHAESHLVVFGVKPERAETSYGYIRCGARIGANTHRIGRFLEKPDAATADGFLRHGNCLWNCGIFLFPPALLLAEMADHRPDILASADSAWAAAVWKDDRVRLPASFARCPAASLDVAVMERTRRGIVVGCDIGWRDLGSWGEVWQWAAKDAANNAVHGAGVALEGSGNLLWSDGRGITAFGTEDLVVVATAQAVLVVPRRRAHEIGVLAARDSGSVGSPLSLAMLPGRRHGGAERRLPQRRTARREGNRPDHWPPENQD